MAAQGAKKKWPGGYRAVTKNFVCIFQPFCNWLDGAKEDLVDMFIVHTVEEIQVCLLLVLLHSVPILSVNSLIISS